LLSNIELAPLRFAGIAFILIHAVGDPIDTLWSLHDKLFAWYRCYDVAKKHVYRINNRSPLSSAAEGAKEKEEEKKRKDHLIRIMATVFAGFEELAGHAIMSDNFYNVVATTLGLGENVQNLEDVPEFASWRKAAMTMVDDRTNELVRTAIAIALYWYQISGNFFEILPETTHRRLGAGLPQA